MGDILFSVFTALCVLFNIAPLCWQIEHNNAGPVCLGFWVIVYNALAFTNAIVWANDAIDRAPVLCDISIKVFAAAPIGILCANLCVLRFLTQVLRPNAPMFTQRDRRRTAVCEYAFCFGIPIFIMATQIIYQPTRYAIARSIGCTMTLVLTWPTYVCLLMWAPTLSCIGCLLSVYVLYRLFCHRRDFKRIVNSANSALTTSRFIRLGLLAICSFLFNLPLSIYSFIETQHVQDGYLEYDWDFIHAYFDDILYNPFLTRAPLATWTAVMAGILVIIFFGFGGEAMSYYCKIFRLLGGHHLPRALRPIWRRSGLSAPRHDNAITEVSLKGWDTSSTIIKDGAWHARSPQSIDTLPHEQTPFDATAVQVSGPSVVSGVHVTRVEEVV